MSRRQKVQDVGKIKILIVDDSDDKFLISRLVKRVIPHARIIYAENGKEGLEIFKSEAPDMVISDVHMPVMPGTALLKEIREINTNVPVFIASAKASAKELEFLIAHNMTGFLNKQILHDGFGNGLSGLLKKL